MRFFFLSLIFAFPAYATTDFTGMSIPEQTPKRVVTLMPSLGELASEILSADLSSIVGVSEYTDYPPSLSQRTSVGPYHQLNLEKIVSLKPDLVLASKDGNLPDQILHLKELGLSVVVISTQNFEEIYQSIEMVGIALGKKERTVSLLAQMKKGIEHLRARGIKRKKTAQILLQVGGDPLVVAGEKSFLNEALKIIGGKNIFSDLPQAYPRPSLETVAQRNPDQILVFALGVELQPYRKMIKDWKKLTFLKAVKENQVKLVIGDSILRPSMRLLEGLSLLEKSVYGEE